MLVSVPFLLPSRVKGKVKKKKRKGKERKKKKNFLRACHLLDSNPATLVTRANFFSFTLIPVSFIRSFRALVLSHV